MWGNVSRSLSIELLRSSPIGLFADIFWEVNLFWLFIESLTMFNASRNFGKNRRV